MTRNNFTLTQQKDMRKRSNDVCEAGKWETEAFYGMAPGETCQHSAEAFDHVTADQLKRTKIQSIDEGLHVCGVHHHIKTQSHDMPKIRKAKRIDAERHGVKRPSRPIPGSKASGIRKRMNGNVERWT
jgi:hypothetical protein